MASGLLDPEFLIGATLANGRFKIVARIGAGSMALVYRAFDHRLETDVVVKVPKKEKLEDPGLRERFNRESRLLVQLQHPHIVRIMDIGMHSNVPYVVMQYLSGGCLQDKLVARNGLPCAVKIPSIRDWVEPVAKALDYAHQQKIVHRDVKPANIMFDHVGNAFLGDFGLTKIMHGDPSEEAVDETAAGFVVGTPNFVAPEIVLGLDYDGRADQYSLGITIYHALLGQPPMRGRSASATMVNQTRRVLPLLSEIRKAVPVKTAEAIARAISKKPDERFSSCVEFANAVIQGLAEGSGAAKVNATAHENVAPDTSGGKSGSDSTSPANSGSSGVLDSSLSSNSPRVSKAKKMAGLIARFAVTKSG